MMRLCCICMMCDAFMLRIYFFDDYVVCSVEAVLNIEYYVSIVRRGYIKSKVIY